jgi:hypothetical protein
MKLSFTPSYLFGKEGDIVGNFLRKWGVRVKFLPKPMKKFLFF